MLKCKFQRLLLSQKGDNNQFKVQLIDDFVVNKSTTQLTQDELNLLNLGLNYAIEPKEAPTEQMITEIEITIASLEPEEQDAIRHAASRAISSSPINHRTSKRSKNQRRCTRK